MSPIIEEITTDASMSSSGNCWNPVENKVNIDKKEINFMLLVLAVGLMILVVIDVCDVI